MPEMPEVETVRRSLEAKLIGKTITKVEVRLPRLIKTSGASAFCDGLEGQTILEVRRLGKGLLLVLSGERALAIHLRMTGRLYVRREVGTKEKFVRILFSLDNQEELVYEDVRTFGTLHLVKLSEIKQIPYLKNLGPEPLSETFTLAYLTETMRKSRGKIKGFLLDQRKIAGLGNIYVDEALYQARLHPCRIANGVSETEREHLFVAINEIIAAAIKNRGTTFRDYVDGEGKKGHNQLFLKVYGRAGEPCESCGTSISRSVVAGRGTHFCRCCQPEKEVLR
ncbi:DNA-formamidopyrimidine glycosylase [Azotosporobacter soli]|uniref:DNA-formamidopyrimidine glycosylase n=1 Tax=Azotosporobacter soli TaxID=3055040 RepID=UPI0031FE82B0